MKTITTCLLLSFSLLAASNQDTKQTTTSKTTGDQTVTTETTTKTHTTSSKDVRVNNQRLQNATNVFQEIMATPDKGIPTDLLDKAHCVVIVPGLKQGGYIVGAKYGVGYMSCRSKSGMGWSAPGTVKVEGGSVGFQIGVSSNDVVLLVMNQHGVDRLLSDQFTLGGEGAVAAGPVGRSATAQTDAEFSAEMLSWSRAHGVFAGVALTGATMRQDLDDNQALYGRRLENRAIVLGKVKPPAAAKPLLTLLDKYSPREQGAPNAPADSKSQKPAKVTRKSGS